ncbi:MAG: DUF4968 domain-containing protein [bacterium]
MYKLKVSFIGVLFLISSDAFFAFEKLDDGITLTLEKGKVTDAGVLKIQICDENIVHITAAPENTFSTTQSLMVDKVNWKPVSWTMEEKEDNIVLSTSEQ